eukprot:365807-Chlamydomonas_euryale.AAC.9
MEPLRRRYAGTRRRVVRASAAAFNTSVLQQAPQPAPQATAPSQHADSWRAAKVGRCRRGKGAALTWQHSSTCLQIAPPGHRNSGSPFAHRLASVIPRPAPSPRRACCAASADALCSRPWRCSSRRGGAPRQTLNVASALPVAIKPRGLSLADTLPTLTRQRSRRGASVAVSICHARLSGDASRRCPRLLAWGAVQRRSPAASHEVRMCGVLCTSPRVGALRRSHQSFEAGNCASANLQRRNGCCMQFQ